MNILSARSGFPARSGRPLAVMLAALLLAAVLGLAAAILPWTWLMLLVMLPLVVGLSLAYPAVGVIFTLMVIFQIIPEQFHPRVPFGGGTLRIHDLMIVYLVGIIVIRRMASRQPLLIPMGPFLWPMVYLVACIGLSVAYVKLAAPNDRLLSEGRYFIAWLLLPLTVLAVDSEASFRLFWRAAIAMAIVMAVYVCLQTFGGVQILKSAKDLALSTTNAEGDAGVIRSAVGGATYLMVLVFFLSINRLIERRWRLIAALPLALLMLAAIGASFGRAVWVSTLIGLFVSSFVFRGLRAAAWSTALIIVLIGAMLGAVMVGAPRTGQAMIDRVSRFGDEVQSGGSFQWRLGENRDAQASIARHPLFGVGIGGDYKNVNRSHGVFAVETVYIHNGYLYFPVKMGLHATLIPVFFIIAAFVAVRRTLERVPPPDRARIAALAGTFAMMCIVSMNQPEWTALSGIAAFCLTMALMVLEGRFGASGATATGLSAVASRASRPDLQVPAWVPTVRSRGRL